MKLLNLGSTAADTAPFPSQFVFTLFSITWLWVLVCWQCQTNLLSCLEHRELHFARKCLNLYSSKFATSDFIFTKQNRQNKTFTVTISGMWEQHFSWLWASARTNTKLIACGLQLSGVSSFKYQLDLWRGVCVKCAFQSLKKRSEWRGCPSVPVRWASLPQRISRSLATSLCQSQKHSWSPKLET